MTNTDPIKALVGLEERLKHGLVNDPVHGKRLRDSAMNYEVVETILAAIEALQRPPSPAPVDDGELVERVDDYMKRIQRIEEVEKDILMLRDALKPFANLDFGGYTYLRTNK